MTLEYFNHLCKSVPLYISKNDIDKLQDFQKYVVVKTTNNNIKH